MYWIQSGLVLAQIAASSIAFSDLLWPAKLKVGVQRNQVESFHEIPVFNLSAFSTVNCGSRFPNSMVPRFTGPTLESVMYIG